MNKKSLTLVTALAIGFLCYVAILSLLTPVFSPVYFIALVFSLVAVAIQAVIICLFLPNPTITDFFYQEPTSRWGIAYLMVQAIASLVLSVLTLDWLVALIVEILILGIFGSLEFYLVYTGLYSQGVAKKYEADIAPMRDLTKQAKAIVDETTDYEWKRLAKGVLDEIQYANPVSGADTARLEADISFELGALRDAVSKKDRAEFDACAQRIKSMLAQR